MYSDQPNPDLIKAAQKDLSSWRISYFAYCVLFYCMSVAIIVFPTIVAANFLPDWNRLLAAATAIIAGLFAWSRLDLVTGNLDKAWSDLRAALLDYKIQKIDGGAFVDALRAAEDITRKFSPGVPQQQTRTASEPKSP
jgi:hypothetical protein